MLQPRRRRGHLLLPVAALLLLLDARFARGLRGDEEAERLNPQSFNRERRQDDASSVLLSPNTAWAPLGVLSSTARTFVQDGTTTEYVTQLVATTAEGERQYTQTLLTTSRVFYDASVVRPLDHHVRPTVPLRPHFVYPSKQPFVLPARHDEKVINVFALPDTTTNNERPTKTTTERQYGDALDEILRQSNDVKKFGPGTQFAAYKDTGTQYIENEDDSSENQLKAKRMGDYFVGSDSERHASQEVEFNELKPAKVVHPVDGLPTVTIRHDFAPSAFSVDEEDEDTTESRRKDTPALKNGRPRNGKLLYRGGALNSLKKLDTVTYYGFADFSTTVGDTVIIFMPNTKSPETPNIPVTSITGPATLSNDQLSVVTTVKTFMSHTPGMVTRTVTGHSLSMQTALPTMVVLPETSSSGIRNNKALDSSAHVTEADANEETEAPSESYDQMTFEQTSSYLAQEQEMFQSTTPDAITSSEYEIEPSIVDSGLSSTLELRMSSTTNSDDQEIVVSTPYLTEVITEPTELPWTFATTRTQAIDHGDNPTPEGLIKAIAGTRALDGTTTLFTSLIYGTYEAGKYTQVIHSTSSVFFFVDETTSTEPLASETIKPSAVIEVPPSTEMPDSFANTYASVDPPPTTTEDTMVQMTTDEQKTTHDDESLGTVPVETTTEINNEVANEIDFGHNVHANQTDATNLTADESTEAVKENEGTDENAKIEDSSRTIIQYPPTQSSSFGQITQLIPSKVFKTFTYLTTFFIPDGPSTTTSIRSREVTSEEITFLTTVIDVPSTSQAMQISSSPTVSHENLPTTVPEIDIKPITQEEPEHKSETISTETPVDTLQETEEPNNEVTDAESTTETTPSPTPAIKLSEPVDVDEEEIDLIFKTLYTTFTYLTTFFHETTTSVSSREVVETNIVTSTLDKNFLARETDPAVAGLFGRDDSFVSSEILPTSVGVGRPTTQYLPESATNPDAELYSSVIDSEDVEKELTTPTPALDNEVDSKYFNDGKPKTFYKTYTYFTTIFVDDETTVTSKTEVFTNIITPNKQLNDVTEKIIATTSSQHVPLSSVLIDQLESPQSNIPNIIQPSREYTPLRSLVFKSTPHYSYSSTISRNNQKSEIINSQFQDNPEVDDDENKILSDGTPYLDREYAYSTTISRPHITQNEDLNLENTIASKSPIASRGINEKNDGINMDRMVVESMSTDVTSSTSGGGQMLMLERNDRHSPLDDQISSESNTEEIQPSATLLLQTYFTTFTFFTTLYKGTSSSDVISRLETVTNVVTETLSPQATTQVTETDDQSLPVTYFTTYTYWTTLYKDGSSTITSREETVSNIITPTATKDFATSIVMEPTPVNTISEILPSELLEIPSSLNSGPSVTSDQPVATPAEELSSSTDTNGPATVYTTYTYFMTSYIGDSTVVKSRLETVSSVLNTTMPQTDVKSGRALGTAPPPQQLLEQITKTSTVDSQSQSPSLLPTGLLSTILTSQINNGTTTLYSTDVFGTYIDGYYAKVLESSTTIVTPQPTPVTVSQANLQPTGIVSLNEGRIIDADGVTTTFYTTKAIGTYIDNLYAQVLESSSSLKVDPEKQSLISALVTTAEPFRTGLVRIIDGSIVKDNTTTFYESKVVGTVIEGRYAQVIESTSSFKIDMTPTPVPTGSISASSVQTGGQDIQPTVSVSTLPSPVVIESSIDDGESKTESDSDEKSDEHKESDEKEDSEEDENDEKPSSGKSRVKSRLTFPVRKNTFTPQIRPFVIKSRNRPAFNPRHKSSATTITRTSITPTITASPAKSNERSGPSGGSSRGRFSGNRRQSSQNNVANEIQPTASSGSRRFSRNRGSSTPGTHHSSSNYQGRARGRSSSSGRIFATSTLSSGNPSRRASIYKSSAGRGSSSIFPGGAAGRLRIRPTLSSGLGRGFPSTASVSTTPKSSDDTLSPDDTTLSVTEETDLYAEEDHETPTQPISTSTESFRRSTNPLLRLRRPLNIRGQQSLNTTPRTNTTPAKKTSSSRKQNNENRTPSTTPKSLRARPVSSIASRYKPVGNRSRPGNSLFPPRGLFRKPEQEENEEAEEEEEENDEKNEGSENEEKENDEDSFAENEDIGDNDYEGSEKSESKTLVQSANRRSGKSYQPVQIRPFPRLLRRPRTKRQTEYGTRREGGTGRTYGRFRRPGSKSGVQAQDRADTAEETAATPEPPKSKSSNTGRFTPRQRNQAPQSSQKIRPTSASNSGRSQFTLREKDTNTNTRSNFKRPSTSSSAPRRRPNKNSRTETTPAPVPQRPKPPRLRTQQKTQSRAQKTQSHAQPTETTFTRANQRYRNANTNTNRGRGNSRTRYRSETTDFDTFTFTPSSFDGTITVTHQVPTEVTIPILNGKVTEYRNIITASPSTEILGPHQYTATIGKEGNTVFVLTSEATGTLPGGVTEITQFFLRDTPTTSVVFTPTVIRGRKTSFSHVVPSTVYDVEQVVSTLQPQISPNAPLANILLSQLLLGNLGLQPNINPLLALNNNNAQPPSPTTEYKTRTTSYVTTVTKGTSTVIPLTFRGKEILTTIVDQSEEVITATEFLTDTIVVTPTAANNQLNSLLLPALLQAQLLGQNQPQATSNPLLGLQQQLLQPENVKLLQNDVPTLDDEVRRQGIPTRQRTVDDDADRLARESESDDILDNSNDSLQATKDDNQAQSTRTKQRKRLKASDPKPPDPPPAPVETSVVTLYVSGRRPGEFSTVLSTVTLGEEPSIRKREAPNRFDTTATVLLEAEKSNIKDDTQAGPIKVDASRFPDLGSSFTDRDDEITNRFIMSAMNEVSADISTTETQSLESMVGDVSRHLSTVQTSIDVRPASLSTTQKTNEHDVATSATKTINGTGHFLLNSPAEFPPLQRKGMVSPNGGSNKSQTFTDSQNCQMSNSTLNMCSTNLSVSGHKYLTRETRDLTNDGQHDTNGNTRKRRRKVIRVRVPINKDRNNSEEEHDIFALSEAQRKETIPDMDTSLPKDDFQKDQDHNKPTMRRVKIIRNRKPNHSQNSNETKNEMRQVKRILVARRKRPMRTETTPEQTTENAGSVSADQTVMEKLHDEHVERISEENTETNEEPNKSVYSRYPVSSSRKLIRVTKKHPLSQLPASVSSHKRRIIVTKRRPIHKTSTAEMLTKPVSIPTATYPHQHIITSERDQNESPDTDKIVAMTYTYTNQHISSTDGTKRTETETTIYPTLKTKETFGDETVVTESPHTFEESTQSVLHITNYDQKFSSSILSPISASVIEPTVEEQHGMIGSHATPIRKDENYNTVQNKAPHVPIIKSPEVFIPSNPTPKEETVLESLNDKNQNVTVSKEKQEEQANAEISTETIESDSEASQESTSETSEGKSESSSTYEGPRFIRPTRFSITRKPGRTKASFSGQKRRNSSPSTTHRATPSSNYKTSYRGRKTSSRSFGRGSNSPRGFRSSTKLPKIEATDTSYSFESVEPTTAPNVLNLENDDLHKSVFVSSGTPAEYVSVSTIMETPPLPDIATKTADNSHDYTDLKQMSTIENLESLTTTAQQHEAVATDLVESLDLDTSKENTETDTELQTETIIPTLSLTTHVITTTRLRTYTFIVTRVDGTDEYITSTTEVKPHLTKVTLTEPVTTVASTQGTSGRSLTLANPNEARLHLATKVMSNGVEVIVAGDRSTMPGDPEVLRILTSSLARPITLAPSTLSDQMVMMLPPSESQEPSSTSLPCRELVTKTYLTTYTYMTTFLQGGSTTISSSKKVVSNVVTEEASALITMPPPAYTLTGSPTMSTGIFHTTYTYLNTVMDGDQPLVLTSKHTVANTVTAPEEHFAKITRPSVDTNTYLNTVALTKTMTDDAGDVSITSTNDVVTQVVITESENPQPVATRPIPQGSFTDIVKTYFVTYTYYNTFLQDGSTVVQSDIAISSDVVTEKVFVPQKKTSLYQEILHEPSKELDIHATKSYLTTFTYYTTLLQDAGNDKVSTVVSSRTHVVENLVSEAVPSSLLPSGYISSLTNSMREESTDTIVATATLLDGHEIMVTAIEKDKNISPTSIQNSVPIASTVASTVASTGQPELASSMEESSENPSNIITGSTIIFFDNFDQESISEYSQPTPALSNSYIQTTLLQHDGSTMKPIEPLPLSTVVSAEETNSEDIQSSLTNTVQQTSGDETVSSPPIITTILASSTVASNGATLQPGEQVIMMTQTNGSVTMIPLSDPAGKRPTVAGDTSSGSEIQVSDLLSLGSLGINGLNALGPVINAMAGLIQSNFQTGDLKRRNDTLNLSSLTSPRPIIPDEQPHPVYIPDSPGNAQSDSGVRSPIYIPVGGLAADFDGNDDIVAAESQNIENRLNLHGGNMKWLSQLTDVHERKRPSDVIMGRPTMESPLLSDGIPISPGQVITANSDVIVGKPAIMGPRPPKLNNNNDVPIGMKPPPLPQGWPPKLHQKPVIPHIHPPFRPMPEGNVHFQPPLPFGTDQQRFENSRYSLPIPDSQNIFNFGPSKPLELSSVQTMFLGKPIKNSHQEHHNNANDIIHGIPEPPMAHAEPVPIGIPTVDRVSGKPMLVNIQPSQVANVLIPHGSSTESFYTLRGGNGNHYDKSPFPFPETNAEFVGLDDSGQHNVGTVHSDDKSPQTEPELQTPSGSINVDISPGQGINVGVAPAHIAPSGIITQSPKNDVYNPGTIFDSPNHHRQHHQSLKPKQPLQPSVPSGFMIPPPPPPKHRPNHVTGRPPIVIPLNEERIEDIINSHKKKDNPYGNDKMEEEIQVGEESIRRPLKPGQIPVELQLQNSVSTHRPIFFTGNSDSKPTPQFHDSAVQSRPHISYVDKPPLPILLPQPIPAPVSNKKHSTVHQAQHPHVPQVYVSPQQPTQRPNNIPHNIAVFGRPQPVESYATVDFNTHLQNKKPAPTIVWKPNVPNNNFMHQEHFGENTGIPFDENKYQNNLPDLNVHLAPPPLHPTTQHGGRPTVIKFPTTENKENSQSKQPEEKLQRPKYPVIVPPSLDLEVQSNTPKPFYERPSLSQPILVPHKPQIQTEATKKEPEAPYLRPDISHNGSNKRPEPPHKFTEPEVPSLRPVVSHNGSNKRPEPPHKFTEPEVPFLRPDISNNGNNGNNMKPEPPHRFTESESPILGPDISHNGGNNRPEPPHKFTEPEVPFLRPEISNIGNNKKPEPPHRFTESEVPIFGPGISHNGGNKRPEPPHKFTVSEAPFLRPDISNNGSNKKPEQIHKFTMPTRTEPPRVEKPSWSHPALYEIPSPPMQPQAPIYLEEETSTEKDSVSTYKPSTANYGSPNINKPIIHPSSVHATSQVSTKKTVTSEMKSFIKSTMVHNESTVKPTKPRDDMMLQTALIGKPIQDVDISPTTVKEASPDFTQIIEWPRLEPESSFTDERHQPTSTLANQPSSSKPQTTQIINVSTLSSGSETYYGELFTRPTTAVTNTVPSYRPAEVENNVHETDDFDMEENEKSRPDLGVASSNDETIIYVGDEEPYEEEIPSYTLPTRYVTHTQTLTVTTTETIVVSSLGKMPSTKTLVLTKTQTSTVVDTVTETRTLVKPTSVTATVTTTVSTTLLHTPPATTKVTTERPTKPTTTTQKPVTEEENESFFVVVNDHKPSKEGSINNAIFLGGVLVPVTSQPAEENLSTTSCRPDCSATRNELCQESGGQMHCVCRPGFARMFPDQPCKPTYTYNMKLPLERHGKMKLQYDVSLEQAGSLKHSHLSEATREGLDRMVMQSDLRDVYHGVAVRGFQPVTNSPHGVLVNFYVQLSDNTDEERLMEVFKKSLRTTNYSLGGTNVFADKKRIDLLEAEDFNECSSPKFHDCSENAYCFNLRGTYTCSCKEGYADLSENSLFPGRVCSAELIGCEKCHYHGSCHSQGDDQVTCECFQWYTGENCHVNLKVLLIALVTIGALLLALLLVCIVLACIKKCRATNDKPRRSAPGFLRYRGTNMRGDKRAMIQDSSSEGSVDNGPVSFIAPPPPPPQPVNVRPIKKPSAMKKVVTTVEPAETIPNFTDQRDRSLTVMIPRAKYRPVPPMSPMLTMSTFGAPEKRAIAQEQKLISYLENGGKQENRSKPVIPIKKQSTASNQRSEPAPSRKTSYSHLRKQSTTGASKVCGALVSAGFEVSATVNHKTTNDVAPEIHNNTLVSNESEHTTLRTGDRTVSEARSCDETTIQAPTKTLHSHYGSKNGSNTLNNDEAHTMAERDLGSTLLMPQTHLYKPDRGSDISNFDSL